MFSIQQCDFVLKSSVSLSLQTPYIFTVVKITYCRKFK